MCIYDNYTKIMIFQKRMIFHLVKTLSQRLVVSLTVYQERSQHLIWHAAPCSWNKGPVQPMKQSGNCK